MTTPAEQASDNTIDAPRTAQVNANREPIPGYVLKERIGTGGFGEVWKAEAPGGLLKAVKFVYGKLDEAAASRELEALEQIKRVHHPLLLSLERIEIVDGRLVIVSELAKSSLKDRFDACKEAGMDGIPRDELLRYLGDAADALDYLYEEHSLQHLDVKPENLLLVGNRVKIADFGLVRDLRTSGESHGGGVTPLYSAPEVLRGEPTRVSDQYSLAIVYQQMLTGEPPFAGRTFAQLAAQHHHCKPVLKLLPQSDQAVIARALSKEPSKRFPGCRVLIDNLLRAGVHGSGGQRTKTPRQTRSTARGATDVGRGSAHDASAVAKTMPFSLEKAAIEKLPTIDLSEKPAEYRPAVFIGVGRTGAQTLMRLHQRLDEVLGDLDRIPCLQMLLIDTDSQSLGQATEAESAAAVRGRDTLVMPLRPPHEYRPKSEQLLEWLSRRWLYNIPRSLSTEGFRPLGRLALVDHSDKLIERLRNAIGIATDAESLAPSTENAGIPFQSGPPRVFIVASTAGGTGSGTALDLAYVVRELLVEQGLSDDAVYGILAHSTTRNADKRDLAIANTYAFLMELKHLSRVGGHYPGDAAFGLLASYQRDVAFQHTYLVHLGDELTDAQYQSGVDALAEYLYLNCATPASAFFDSSRDGSGKNDPYSQATMRTFAIGRPRKCDNGPLDRDLALLCRSTIATWLGSDALGEGENASRSRQKETGDASNSHARASTPEVEGIVAGQIGSLDLRLAPLVERALGIAQTEFGRDIDGYLRQMIESVKATRVASAQASADQLFADIDGFLTRSTAHGPRALQADGLKGVLTGQMARFLARKTTAARQWLIGLMEVPQVRLDGACQAAVCFAKQLGKIESSASQVVQRLANEVAELSRQAVDTQSEKLLLQYGKLRVYEMAHRCVRDGVRAMRLEITASAEELLKLHRTLIDVAAKFDSQCAVPDQEQVPDNGEGSPDQSNSPNPASQVLELMDRQMRNRFADADHSLHSMLGGKLREPKMLYKSLCETGRAVLRLRSGAANGQPPECRAGSEQHNSDIDAWIDEATPKLINCGGGKRMLMLFDEQSDIAAIKRDVEQTTGDSLTAVAGPRQDALLCCEMERVPLDNIAAALINGRREYAELASRLHTRIDVKWPDE